jgi:hypothetical protein
MTAGGRTPQTTVASIIRPGCFSQAHFPTEQVGEIVTYLAVQDITDHLLCIVIRNCSNMMSRIGDPIFILRARMACYEQLPGRVSRQLKRARGEDLTVTSTSPGCHL